MKRFPWKGWLLRLSREYESFSLKKRHSLSLSLYYSDLAETSSVFPELKSKLKNHYRAHRLSFWLNLVPDLHKPGSDDVPRSHHLLDTEQVSFLSLSFSFLSYIFVWTIEFLIRGFARWRCRPGSSRGCQRRLGWQLRRWPWPKELTTSRQRHPANWRSRTRRSSRRTVSPLTRRPSAWR